MFKKFTAWGIPITCFTVAITVGSFTEGMMRVRGGTPPRSQTCKAPRFDEPTEFFNFVFGKKTSFLVTGATIFGNPAVPDGTLDTNLVDPQNIGGSLTSFQLPPTVQDLGKHPDDPEQNARCLCVCVYYPAAPAAGGAPAQYAFSLGLNEPVYGLSTPFIALARPKTFTVGDKAKPCCEERDIAYLQLIRSREENPPGTLTRETVGFSNMPPDYVVDVGGEDVIFANPYPPARVPNDPSYSGQELKQPVDKDGDHWVSFADMPGPVLPTVGFPITNSKTLDFKTFFMCKTEPKLHGDASWGDKSDIVSGGGASVTTTSRQALQLVDEPVDNPVYIKTITLYFTGNAAGLKKFLPK